MTKKAPPKPKGIHPSSVRRRKMQSLSQTIGKLTKSMLGRQGFTQGAIITQWPDIVGAAMARHTVPEKISFSRDGVSHGTLLLRCESGALATELQHQSPQILDRINAFFGYQAVTQIKLIQAPVAASRKPQNEPQRALNAAEAQSLSETIAPLKDEDLRKAFEKMGTSIFIRNSDKT